MKLGEKVEYIVQRGDGAIQEGEGVIIAFGLDAFKRKTAHLDIGGESINAFLPAINPSEEYKAKFRQMTLDVRSIAEEGNAKVKVIVEKYNRRVDKVQDPINGKPIKVEIMPRLPQVKPVAL